MSSANKTLKTSDVSVVPYKASRNRIFTYSEFSSNGIVVYSGSNEQQSTTASLSPKGLMYRSIRHLYYSHDLPSLAPTQPLSEQNYTQLQEDQNVTSSISNTLMYDNYLQSTAASGSIYTDTRHFPTASNAQITVISIPQVLYGEQLQKGTFELYDDNTDYNLLDDSNGNIYDGNNQNRKVGNIIYSQGLALLTDPTYAAAFNSNFDPNNIDSSVRFNSEITIYQNQVRCHINENEFNMTLNPSALSGSNGVLQNNVTGSDFHPYVTAIGLYSAANDLLAISKLAQPFPMPSNTDVTFVVKWDS